MEIRPDGMAPLHNYDLCIISFMESFP